MHTALGGRPRPDSDVAAIAREGVRFAGIVFPVITIVTSMWPEDDRTARGSAWQGVEELGDCADRPPFESGLVGE